MTNNESTEKSPLSVVIPAALFNALAEQAEREGLTVHQHATRVLERAVRDLLDS